MEVESKRQGFSKVCIVKKIVKNESVKKHKLIPNSQNFQSTVSDKFDSLIINCL